MNHSAMKIITAFKDVLFNENLIASNNSKSSSNELKGKNLLESMLKEIASDEKEWMDHQVSIILLANKIILPLIYKDEWDLNKNKILKQYGIPYIPNGLAINVPRQMGKTEVVSKLLAQWMKDITTSPSDPFTILTPGIQKTTYQEFIARTYSHLKAMDLSEFTSLDKNKSEIILTKGNSVKKLQGLCVNSNVRLFLNCDFNVVYFLSSLILYLSRFFKYI